MTLLLLSIAVIIPWVLFSPSNDLRLLRRLSVTLCDLDAAARAGVVDPWRVVSASDAGAWSCLEPVMRRARRSGCSIVGGVSALRRLVARGIRRTEQKSYLIQIIRTRLSLMICLAALARLFLSQGSSWDLIVGDRYCVAAAAIATCLATRWLGRCFPRVWLCAQPVEVAAWLDGYIRGAVVGAVCSELVPLCHREVREGIDLSREKRRVLVAWARRRGDAERLRIRRLIEVLPLIEIFGFGLIASLVLAGPAVSAWHWTESEGSANPSENDRGSE